MAWNLCCRDTVQSRCKSSLLILGYWFRNDQLNAIGNVAKRMARSRLCTFSRRPWLFFNILFSVNGIQFSDCSALAWSRHENNHVQRCASDCYWLNYIESKAKGAGCQRANRFVDWLWLKFRCGHIICRHFMIVHKYDEEIVGVRVAVLGPLLNFLPIH